MQKKVSGGSCRCMYGQKRRIIFVSVMFALVTGSCWGMYEDVQQNETACHKSCEQCVCTSSGIVVGYSVSFCSEVGMVAQENALFEPQLLGPCTRWPRECFFGGVAVTLLSLKYHHKPDHSCICGYCQKMKRAIVCRKNEAPLPITMAKKKD